MALIRWDPFFRGLNCLFEETQSGSRPDEAAATAVWSSAVEIDETESEIVVKAEIPGVDPQDIDLRLEHSVLRLKTERPGQRSPDRTILRLVPSRFFSPRDGRGGSYSS